MSAFLAEPEVGMDPMAARLAALRLAPVQCNGWGHPTTSGYPTLDYFLSSELMEPEGADAHYSERLVRLPGLSTTIHFPEALPPAMPRGDMGLEEEDAVYWCGQSLYKYLPQHDWVFPAIASRNGASRFLFIEFPGSAELTGKFQSRMERAFETCGLAAERHCRILPRLDADGFLRAMQAADVVLDSIGWSGCNSLVDAMSAGLPIVTLRGNFMRARHGSALIEAFSGGGTICEHINDYVTAAAALGTSGRHMAKSREGIEKTTPEMFSNCLAFLLSSEFNDGMQTKRSEK